MSGTDLSSRLEFLRNSQNADGGWGYVPGNRSWLEPTVYSALALHGQPEAEDATARAFDLIRGWQMADGGWRPGEGVERACWSTALAVTLHCVRGVNDEAFQRGVDWLVVTQGAEGSWLKRIMYLVKPKLFGYDPTVLGWPWLPGTGSWVEPTCHALTALRLASGRLKETRYPHYRKLLSRVKMAEKMMQQRRAMDGGWNYGNKVVLGEELPSYPETTGIALVGMLGCEGFDPQAALAVAERHYRTARSPLARAWLAIGLRNHGASPRENGSAPTGPPRYVHLAALEALAAPDGNFFLLKSQPLQ